MVPTIRLTREQISIGVPLTMVLTENVFLMVLYLLVESWIIPMNNQCNDYKNKQR
jgi:type IV secretory pathway VirB3-like protein